MKKLSIRFDPDPSPGTREAIRNGVDLHNVAATGLSDSYAITFVLRDADGDVLGGLLGDLWGGWLQVSFLWVARPLRGNGWASKLLRAAERYAVERGAHDAMLDTFSFQARQLYEKLGYEVFATLDDYPPGHARFFLRRRLAPTKSSG